MLNKMPRAPLASVLVLVVASVGAAAGDWTHWRGPGRDGRSPERNLPTRWSPDGENLAWKAPYGSRSTPIVMGGRLYLQNAAGKGARLQERVLCLDAATGKLIWEHRFNVYSSDVPPHRVGWASPVGDPGTGNVYAFGVGGTLLALTRDGKPLWERSLGEDFGLVTTHGGRTVSPVIEGDLVIVSGINSGWGEQARGGHRFMAFDKKTGTTVWVNAPGGRPFDTTYSPAIAAEVGGTRLLIAGGGDGAFHALKPQTGEPVWRYGISKRGLNAGAVVHGTTAIVSHGEENLDSSDMGLLAAVDASAKGKIGKEQVKWTVKGFLGGYSSPILDGERIYQVDNGANLFAFDAGTGRQLWMLNLGTIQKGSPVLGDGKLYVASENGRFFILRPGTDKAEVLDEDQLGTEAAPEAVVASPAISEGLVFVATVDNLYCFGRKTPGEPASASAASPDPAPPGTAPAHVQVAPTELVLKPGDSAKLEARLFDAQGRFIRADPAAAWSLDGLRGTLAAGTFTAAADGGSQAGLVKAAAAGLTGAGRIRVVAPLPWALDFESVEAVPRHWINATGKFAVRATEQGTVLVKLADNAFTKRARAYLGSSDSSDYTVESDVLAKEQRRQMGDAGVVAQRYSLVLFGNHQRLELQAWQPETERTVTVPFSWKPDTWYRMKLQVENLPDGVVRARGKAWPAAEPEPSAWTVERVDPIPNRQGSPGIYADAPLEVFFDNLKVIPNR